MAKETKINKVSRQLTEQLLQNLGVAAQVEVEENADSIKINIVGQDLGILIGFHGETLKALQIILGLLINRDINDGTWYRVLVDVGSWRASRQTSLEEMAKTAMEKVRATGQEVALPPMSPDERRLIHVLTQEEESIESHSEGEGSDRHIVLTLATSKLAK